VTYLLAAAFFTIVLLAAAVTIHMNVRTHWREILLALKGEWGVAPRAETAPAARAAPAYATHRPRAAA
jgi:Flp pilus assembly pilin Flp